MRKTEGGKSRPIFIHLSFTPVSGNPETAPEGQTREL